MRELIYTLAVLTLFTVGIVCILRRAGYSGWWVLLAFVPLVNFIVFALFAFCRWPIEQELARYRVAEGVGRDSDFETLLSHGVSAEKIGNWDLALELYELIKAKSTDKEMQSYAITSLDLLKEKVAEQSLPSPLEVDAVTKSPPRVQEPEIVPTAPERNEEACPWCEESIIPTEDGRCPDCARPL